MNNELEDIILDNNTGEINRFDYVLFLKECFPILVLWVGTIATIFHSIITTHFIISVLFLLVSSISIILFPVRRLYIVFTQLLGAIFQLLIYFHIRYIFGLIGSVSIDIVMMFVMMAFLYVNKLKIYRIIEKNRNVYTEEEISKANQLKVNRFKERFADKSISQLEKIVNENRLIPVAIEAARQLLNDNQK